MKRIALLIAILLLPAGAWGATATCGTNGVNNSCNPSTLAAQISSAAQGDTIYIATGTHNWTSSVTVNKKVTITGGGACPDCGEDGPTALATASWPTILVTNFNMAFLIQGSGNLTDTTFARISGLFIDGDPPNHSYSNGQNTASISMDTNNTMRYRLDNLRFRPSGDTEQSSLRTNSGYGGFGVIDHVYISTTGAGKNGRFIHNTGHGGDAGDTDWSYPVQWGSENFHFLEDITYIFPAYVEGIPAGIEDQQGGGRCVIRYSWSENANLGNHGTESGWPARSGVAQEIYNNHIETQGNMFTANYWRGGSMYMHNNYVEGYQSAIRYRVQRLTSAYGCGVCGSSGCVDIDGPGPPSGFPCIDQVGTGTAAGVGINNTQPQGSNPAYAWSFELVNMGTFVEDSLGDYFTDYIQEGVNVFSSIAGTVRPAGYTPYTYPHPFTSEDPVVGPLTISITTPTNASTYVTDSTPIVVGGSSSSGYTVESVTWANQQALTSGTADGTTTWTDTISLIAGNNTITATATDSNADTLSDIITISYDVDTTDPVATITAPALGATYETDTSPMPVSGTCTDASGVNRVTWSTVNGVTIDSGTATGTTAWSFTTDLALGDNTVAIVCYDDSAAQNTHQDALLVTFTADSVPPSITIATPVGNSTYETSTTPITVTGVAADLSGIEKVQWANSATALSGTATGTSAWSFTVALQSGANPVTVTATDASSNSNTNSDLITVTTPLPADTNPPTVTILSPTTSGTYSTETTPLAVWGTASDVVGQTDSGIDFVTWTNSLGATSGTCNIIPMRPTDTYDEDSKATNEGNAYDLDDTTSSTVTFTALADAPVRYGRNSTNDDTWTGSPYFEGNISLNVTASRDVSTDTLEAGLYLQSTAGTTLATIMTAGTAALATTTYSTSVTAYYPGIEDLRVVAATSVGAAGSQAIDVFEIEVVDDADARTWSTWIPLGSGDNVITIKATDKSAAANTGTDAFTVTTPLPPPGGGGTGSTPEGECDFQ